MKNTLKSGGMLPVAAALVLLSIASARADYPTLILSDHPVAYYRLEETSGSTAVDSSTNGFNATYIFNSTLAFPALGLPGIDTNSVGFNGGADFGFVDIPYNIKLSPTNGDGVTGAPFSAECWVNASSQSLSDYTSPLAMSGPFAGNYTAAGSGWNFYQTQGPNSRWQCFIRGTAVNTLDAGPVTLGQWYHLAITWDNTNATLYLNGVAASSGAIVYRAVDPTGTGFDGAIGSGPQTGHGAFDGGVDEVAFYDYTLSAAQILAHYQSGTNSFRVPPVPPTIQTDVASATNFSGTTASFSVLANGPGLSYQWFRGTNAIGGQTNTSYSFVCSFPADNGATFHVTVSNGFGSTNSSIATLTVLTNLNIIAPPFSITRNVGGYAAFRVAAGGALPISYQWMVSSNSGGSFAPVTGATSDTLWLTNVQLSMSGYDYEVLVGNPFTSNTPPAASLSVQARPVNVPITGYATIIANDHPVAYWRLNETNGTAATDAVGSFDGAYDNTLGPVTLGVPRGPGIQPGVAVDVADTNEAVAGQGGVMRVPYALELNPYGPWTAEAWVRPDSNDPDGNFRTVFSSEFDLNSGTAFFGWNIYQHPASAWTLNIFNGTGAPGFFGSDFANIPLNIGSWYHLVLTDDGTTIQLYVNGVAGSANTTVAASGFTPNGVNGDPTLTAAPEVLGQRSDGAFFGFSGAFSDVAWYNYALTPAQVKFHYVANTEKLTIVPIGGGKVVITWPSGTLQSSANVSTGYTDFPGSPTSPFTNTVSGPLYYRIRIQ